MAQRHTHRLPNLDWDWDLDWDLDWDWGIDVRDAAFWIPQSYPCSDGSVKELVQRLLIMCVRVCACLCMCLCVYLCVWERRSSDATLILLQIHM